MAVVLALPRLFDAVVARFAADATVAPCVFGWRERNKRSGLARRIVWTPGDEGDVGSLGAARSPGANPRSLGTLHERFTVDIEAQDATNAENERAQYQIVMELFDAWWRAVYLAAHGTVAVESVVWVTDTKERRFGATLRAVCTIDHMIPDMAAATMPTESKASIATSEFAVTETTLVASAVEVATTAAITLSGTQTVDGVVLVAGNRVLVKNQAAGETNGIYVVSAGVWARAVDADTSAEVPSGLLVHVVRGTVSHNTDYILTTPAPIVLGTTPLVFTEVES